MILQYKEEHLRILHLFCRDVHVKIKRHPVTGQNIDWIVRTGFQEEMFYGYLWVKKLDEKLVQNGNMTKKVISHFILEPYTS